MITLSTSAANNIKVATGVITGNQMDNLNSPFTAIFFGSTFPQSIYPIGLYLSYYTGGYNGATKIGWGDSQSISFFQFDGCLGYTDVSVIGVQNAGDVFIGLNNQSIKNNMNFNNLNLTLYSDANWSGSQPCTWRLLYAE